MERKAKVTQDAVTDACDELMESGKNVTVNAIIAMTGGSFSTVGAMVKNWKAEQALKTAPAIEMPETVKTAMHKAVTVIWDAASSLASDEIDRIRKEAGEGIDKAKIELSEYVGEITRLEKELEQSQNITAETEKRLSTAMTQISELITQKTALETNGSHAGVRPKGASIPYSATKAALNHMTKLLALSLGPDIRVNGVAPGLVDTPLTADWTQTQELWRTRAPMRRSAKPEDIAQAVAMLVASDYLTGEILLSDGGLNLT